MKLYFNYEIKNFSYDYHFCNATNKSDKVLREKKSISASSLCPAHYFHCMLDRWGVYVRLVNGGNNGKAGEIVLLQKGRWRAASEQ